MASLSRRGSGQTAAESSGSVASDFAGKFVLDDGFMTFSNLTFEVPGASVDLIRELSRGGSVRDDGSPPSHFPV